MKKKWLRLRWFVTECMKPAVQMPNSDKLARFNLLNWGGLVVMTLLILTLTAFLKGWAWPFWIGLQVLMVGVYATIFMWSVDGYFYRRDIRKQEDERRKFNEIVRNA